MTEQEKARIDEPADRGSYIMSLKAKIACANIFVPYFFVQINQWVSWLFNPNPDLAAGFTIRLAMGFRPFILVLFLVMVSINTIIILRLLEPLFKFLKGRKNEAKARTAAIRIPLLLVLTHVGLWIFAVGIFYAVYAGKTPGGMPFLWSLLMNVSAGFIGALFTSLIINNILIEPKKHLGMIEIRQNENDLFSRVKDFLIYSGNIFMAFLSTSYIGRYYVLKPASASEYAGFTLTTVCVCVIYFITALLLFFLSRREHRLQIQYLKTNLEQLASGKANMSKRINLINFDEIGSITWKINQFIDMLGNLVKMIKDFQSQSKKISGQLENQADQYEQAMERFIRNIKLTIDTIMSGKERVDNTKNTMSEIQNQVDGYTRTILQQADMTDVVSTKVKTLLSEFLNVIEISKQAADDIKLLDNSTRENSEKLQDFVSTFTLIEESAGNVHKQLRTITDISDRTNILALNAAIEAAHAGQKGKGFAIVADEVRKLSAETSQSIKSIDDDINQMQERTDSGLGSVTALRNSLGEMIPAIESVTSITGNVLGSMLEQQNNAETALESLNELAEANTSMKNIATSQHDKTTHMAGELSAIENASNKTFESTTSLQQDIDIIIESTKSLNTAARNNFEQLEKLSELVNRFTF